ncbi:MAG: hypothetical protein OEZ13_13410 [Spirochaetia bacterium]|nr:hypothetical protein [Spirochaetia bacterium]
MKVKIQLTKEYFQETFDEIMMRAKKWIIIRYIVSVVLIFGGVSMALYSEKFFISASLLVSLGLLEMFSLQIKKIIWLKKQMKSPLFNETLEVSIGEKSINFKGQDSNSGVNWDAFYKFYFSKNGIVLWPVKRLIIYLPHKVLGPKGEKLIKEKLSKNYNKK